MTTKLFPLSALFTALACCASLACSSGTGDPSDIVQPESLEAGTTADAAKSDSAATRAPSGAGEDCPTESEKPCPKNAGLPPS